jgi:hypothetical protein
MSYSTQLTRGAFALPLLIAFGLLALSSNESLAERSLDHTPPTALVLRAVGSAACANLPRAPMLLAHAPGDLGPLAQRALRAKLAASCRA